MRAADRLGHDLVDHAEAREILCGDLHAGRRLLCLRGVAPQDLSRFGVIDQIVTEPIGGAHRDPAATISSAGEAIANALDELKLLDRDAIRQQRRDKFLAIGRTIT